MRGSPDDVGIPAVPVALIPVLVFPGEAGRAEDAMIDSTFQIRRLEKTFPSRSIIPPDPALAFLDALLEDYADEWLTKPMFHYRWKYAADIHKASHVLALDRDPLMSRDTLAKTSQLHRRAPDRTAARGRLQRRNHARHRGELPAPARPARFSSRRRASIPHGRAARGQRLRPLRPVEPVGAFRSDARCNRGRRNSARLLMGVASRRSLVARG